MAWGTALGSGGARPLAHKATVGCDSTNDRAERAIGYFSHVYNTYGTIDFVEGASSVATARLNDIFGQRSDDPSLALFHALPLEMR